VWAKFWQLLDRFFFGPRAEGDGPLPAAIRILRYVYAVVRDLSRGQINLRATGLVFTTLLSVIPLIAFAFAVLKIFGEHRELEPIVYEFFRPLGAVPARNLTSRVMLFADRVSTGVIGSLGFAFLLWTLLGTIKQVEDSLNFVWRVGQPRSFARRAAEYLSLLIIGPILLVGFITLSHAALQSQAMKLISELPLAERLIAQALELSPYAMVSAFFTALYMFIPNTRVQLAPALVGGLAAGLLWAAVGKMFTEFVVFSTRLTVVYAGFAVIVAALLWTYFGWVILLAGAQLSFYIQNPAYLRLGHEELKLSAAEREQLALKIMYLIGDAHVRSGPVWTVNALAREVGLPPVAVAELTDELEGAGLLIATEHDSFVPGKDIGQIPLIEVLDVARTQRSGHPPAKRVSVAAVEDLMKELDEARRELCGRRTVRDLVDRPEKSTVHNLQSTAR
jgi:membrane protein